MNRYIVYVNVMTTFSYKIEADSEEEAKDLVESGEIDANDEDIDWDSQEVTVELIQDR